MITPMNKRITKLLIMYINISPQVGLWIEHRFNLDKKSKKAGKCKDMVNMSAI
jgi:hypothetical protein